MTEMVAKKFESYVAMDTRANPNSEIVPSSQGQSQLAYRIVEELGAIGLSDVRLVEGDSVIATVPSNVSLRNQSTTIAFITHIDTAPNLPSVSIPRLIHSYDGSAIPLDASNNVILDQERFPSLRRYLGDDLYVTDGMCLLGADDKAGVAVAMTAAAHLVSHPDIPHGEVRIIFASDEELGRSGKRIIRYLSDVDFAYTLDGGPVGQVQCESYYGINYTICISTSDVTAITGNTHVPSSASEMGMLLQRMLREEENGLTNSTSGFSILRSIIGDLNDVRMEYLIRDFDRVAFVTRTELLNRVVNAFAKDKANHWSVSIEETKRKTNIREYIEAKPTLIKMAKEAIENLSLEPDFVPFGGDKSDAIYLSERGIPCVNLGMGCENPHSHFEYCSRRSLELSVKLVLSLVYQVLRLSYSP